MADGVTLNSGAGGATIDTEAVGAGGSHIQRIKIVTGARDTDGGDVSAANPLSVQPSVSSASALTLGTPYSFVNYGSVVVQVDSLSGGDTISFAGSVASGGTTYPLQVMSLSGTYGTIASTISATGTYEILGAGKQYVTATKAGTASTPIITASASQ